MVGAAYASADWCARMTLEVVVEIERLEFALKLATRFGTGITGVFGPSGVGKTTLLHAILGVEPARRVVCGHRTLMDVDLQVHVATHQRGIGAVFQESRLFPHLSVVQNLKFAKGARTDQQKFDAVVSGLGLAPLLSKSVGALSGGESQRVALGRALLAEPQWLLLDEPLAALDRGAKRQVLQFLKRIHVDWSLPMLFVSHQLEELLVLTQDLLVLQPGGELAHGRYHDILRDRAVLQAMHDLGLLNVLTLHVGEHREDEGITLLKSGSLTWAAPLCGLSLGQAVEVKLRPEDIALVEKPVKGISIQNQLAGEVCDVVMGRERALVYLDVGLELIVEVTPHAVKSMDLRRGRKLYGLFKAQALKLLV